MKKLKFISSILVQGEHCEAGSTKEVPAVIAHDLIAAGSAVEVTKIERAVMPKAKRERAAKR